MHSEPSAERCGSSASECDIRSLIGRLFTYEPDFADRCSSQDSSIADLACRAMGPRIRPCRKARTSSGPPELEGSPKAAAARRFERTHALRQGCDPTPNPSRPPIRGRGYCRVRKAAY